MEKAAVKSKNRLLKLAASAVTFNSPPFSPNRDQKKSSDSSNKGVRKGFSGPTISIIPADSRNLSFATHEPTSPKISCMGQIKHKKKMCALRKNHENSTSPPRDHQFISHSTPLDQEKPTKVLKSVKSFTESKSKKNPRDLKLVQSSSELNKKKSGLKNIFAKPSGKKTGAMVYKAPCLSQTQRFSSGRNSLSNFDWTANQVAPVETDDERSYHSEAGRERDREEDQEDVKISFSAPILIGTCKAVALEPRKEINLWKRRTMAQPKPLQVNTLVI